MRLIDADKLTVYRGITNERGWTVGERRYCTYDEINEAPTVNAEPVVRCIDCRYYIEGDGHEGFCDFPFRNGMPMDDDDFCSYGERREDGPCK